jgi:hypothetical protein
MSARGSHSNARLAAERLVIGVGLGLAAAVVAIAVLLTNPTLVGIAPG